MHSIVQRRHEGLFQEPPRRFQDTINQCADETVRQETYDHIWRALTDPNTEMHQVIANVELLDCFLKSNVADIRQQIRHHDHELLELMRTRLSAEDHLCGGSHAGRLAEMKDVVDRMRQQTSDEALLSLERERLPGLRSAAHSFNELSSHQCSPMNESLFDNMMASQSSSTHNAVDANNLHSDAYRFDHFLTMPSPNRSSSSRQNNLQRNLSSQSQLHVPSESSSDDGTVLPEDNRVHRGLNEAAATMITEIKNNMPAFLAAASQANEITAVVLQEHLTASERGLRGITDQLKDSIQQLQFPNVCASTSHACENKNRASLSERSRQSQTFGQQQEHRLVVASQSQQMTGDVTADAAMKLQLLANEFDEQLAAHRRLTEVQMAQLTSMVTASREELRERQSSETAELAELRRQKQSWELERALLHKQLADMQKVMSAEADRKAGHAKNE